METFFSFLPLFLIVLSNENLKAVASEQNTLQIQGKRIRIYYMPYWPLNRPLPMVTISSASNLIQKHTTLFICSRRRGPVILSPVDCIIPFFHSMTLLYISLCYAQICYHQQSFHLCGCSHWCIIGH